MWGEIQYIGLRVGTALAHRLPVSRFLVSVFSILYRKEKAMNRVLFRGIVCSVVGLATLSVAIASVPKHVTNDAALYQNLSEIRVAREKELNFDRDIAQLSSLEGRYREHLPEVNSKKRVQTPLKRIAEKHYRYSGSKTVSNP